MVNEDWTVEVLSNQTKLLNGDDCFGSQPFALHYASSRPAHLIMASSENRKGPYSFSPPSSVSDVYETYLVICAKCLHNVTSPPSECFMS